ncbi:MAG: PcfJ domain-containing protein [Halomonadaceae bacterium]
MLTTTRQATTGLTAWLIRRARTVPARHRQMPRMRTLDVSRAVGYPLTLHVAAWRSSTPFAWQSLQDGEPLARGEFLSSPGIAWDMLQTLQGDELLAGMPAAVRAVMDWAPFLGIELAQACGRLDAARELAESSPLLLILLVERGTWEGWTLEQLAQRLTHKQPDLCRMAGLCGTKSCARLVRRCRLRPLTRGELPSLRRTLSHDGKLATLRHSPSLRLDHLVFLANLDTARWPGLPTMLDELLAYYADDQRPPAGSTTRLMQTLHDVERMLGHNDPRPQRIDSLAALNRLHDRLVARFNAPAAGTAQAPHPITLLQQYGDYPQPPFEGNERIAPVRSWHELLEEGRTMQHCVGAYHAAVAAGQVAIYHLHDPEPITVALRPQGSGWALSEASGTANASPSPAAMAAIHAWLAQA